MSETDRQLLEAAAKFGALAGQLINRTDVNDDYQTPEVEEILALIGKQSELRCFVDGTRNLGHQASTVAMAKRLVDLTRFAGRLVVVYADYRKDLLGCTAEKLALMFDGLDPSRIDECVSAYGSCRDIRFLDIARSGRLSNPIAFGFTGGADDMSVNYAAALNVRFFARIQPYLWDDDKSKKADPHYESSRIERSDGRHLYLVDACRDFQRLSFKFCRERVVVPDATWNWYADVQRFDAGLRVRTRNARALQEILRDCAEGGTERPLVWPMYGLQHFQRCAAEMLLTCVLSAVKVQAALRKTIVVVLFSPLAEINEWSDFVEPLARDLSDGDERLPLIRAALAERYRGQFLNGTFSNSRLDDLVHAISDWLCVARMRRATVTVHRGHDPATGRFKDITAQLTDSIGGGAPASVHVVAIGVVPRDVFNEWYATSDLPGLIEGQATSSMLNSFGRPFLQILRADHVIKNGYVGALPNKDYATIANDAHETALLVRDAHVERCLRSETDFSPSNFLSSVDRVANFLLLSADSGSEHANYFQAVGKYFSRNIHDKLLIGLLALREVVRADDLCVGADAEPNDAGVRLDGLA